MLVGFSLQSFCVALTNELREYYRLVAVLEAQVGAAREKVGLSYYGMWEHPILYKGSVSLCTGLVGQRSHGWW